MQWADWVQQTAKFFVVERVDTLGGYSVAGGSVENSDRTGHVREQIAVEAERNDLLAEQTSQRCLKDEVWK